MQFCEQMKNETWINFEVIALFCSIFSFLRRIFHTICKMMRWRRRKSVVWIQMNSIVYICVWDLLFVFVQVHLLSSLICVLFSPFFFVMWSWEKYETADKFHFKVTRFQSVSFSIRSLNPLPCSQLWNAVSFFVCK